MLRALLVVTLAGCACQPVPVIVTGQDSGLLADGGLPDLAWGDRRGLDAGAADTAAPDTPRPDSWVADNVSWPDADNVQRRINFQPPGTPPQGYVADLGDVFPGADDYGWDLDLTGETERANLIGDRELDTYIKAGDTGRVDRWELALPPARYLVSLALGAPDHDSGPMRVVAEGVTLIDRERTAQNSFIWSIDREIDVHDGRLTLEAGGTVGPTLLDFVEVRTAQPPSGCAARAEICNGRDDDCDSGTDEEGICLLSSVCYGSTMENGMALSSDGFSVRGGGFGDGGFTVNGPGARVERGLAGNFYQGTLAFEARNLYWQRPADDGAVGCERTVFDLNAGSGRDPAHTRFKLVSVAPDCAGGGEGVLRLTMHSAFCCLQRPLPLNDDGAWHSWVVTWDASEVTLYIDNAEVAHTSYGGASVGRDPYLWFGSGGDMGDISGATFRNLQICNDVTPP